MTNSWDLEKSRPRAKSWSFAVCICVCAYMYYCGLNPALLHWAILLDLLTFLYLKWGLPKLLICPEWALTANPHASAPKVLITAVYHHTQCGPFSYKLHSQGKLLKIRNSISSPVNQGKHFLCQRLLWSLKEKAQYKKYLANNKCPASMPLSCLCSQSSS